MSTTPNKKEQVPNYDITNAKANASTGTLINNQADLNKYGIDYSPEQREEIANIFRAEADAAYNTARNDYAKAMAAEQNTLRDTIRRSQAQSVATGASRGLQAANELSAMLGLQEQAAQGAAQMQGSYAEALANASQKAMEQQNARAQAGANIAAADIAGEAQKYSVNMDYLANDPAKVLDMIKYYESIGDTNTVGMLKTVFMTGQGATEGQVENVVNPKTDWSQAYKMNQYSTVWGSQKPNGEDEDFNFEDTNGNKYRIRQGKTQSTDSAVYQKAISNNVPEGVPFIFGDKIYMKFNNGVHEITRRASYSNHYAELYNKLKRDNFILE